MAVLITTPIKATMALLSMRPSDVVFWGKWAASYTSIIWSRYWKKKRFEEYDVDVLNDPYKTNFLPFPVEYDLDTPLSDEQLQNQGDEIFFYGVNSKSEYLIVRIARGPNEQAEAWIYLRLSDGRTYSLMEMSGYQYSGRDKRVFSCGSLQAHYLCPMRRWRIFFNGMLRDGSETNKMVYVKFAFVWNATSDIFDFPRDLDAGVLAKGLASAKWKTFLPPVDTVLGMLDCYAQSGFIAGTLKVEGHDDEQELFLFGERVRNLGKVSPLVKSAEFYNIFGVTPKNGRMIHITELSVPNVVENLTFGLVVHPAGYLFNATEVEFAADKGISPASDINSFQVDFNAEGLPYTLEGNLLSHKADFKSSKSWEGRLTMDCASYQLNSVKGNGIVVKGKMMQPPKRVFPETIRESLPSPLPLVVQFAQKCCQFSDLTGGKGSSLGKLTDLSEELDNFIVPKGIVVTTSAYEKFLTNDILRAVKELENVLYINKDGDPQTECQKVMDEVIKTSIPDEILRAIVNNLHEVFQGSYYEKKFAIRSSATDEDTEQMSAAGQMETFLGVSGIGEIMSAVKKCWASQFSFIATQYKRQNGQIINSPMAVVIQEMISCDVAGVLFTCDPVTGNPSVMSITANYGLGESVVSGSEEPDTIEVKRHTDDHLEITNKTIGSKGKKIVMKDDGGTTAEEVSENEKDSCCLSDSFVLQLSELAVKIEKSYKSHRDIEWGFWNNNLYIFQSRPVTSGTGETDFEIDHERSAPMRCEEEYYTVCNVGEVMPGAYSPLGWDVNFKYFSAVFQRKDFTDWQSSSRSKYFPKGLVLHTYHAIFYAADLLEASAEDPEAADAAGMALFGRKIDEPELLAMTKERYTCKLHIMKRTSLKANFKRFLRVFFQAKRQLKARQKLYENYRIPVEKYKTASELFDALLFACTDPCEAFAAHMVCSESSSILNMTIFTILRKAAGEVNADVYSDFATLVATGSDVESADVPAAIEKLAHQISEDIDPAKFKKMDVDEAKHWLETAICLSGICYLEFLIKHGHRCLKEFDIHSITWASDPKPLIKLLQNLVGSEKSKKAKKGDVQSIIGNLKTNLNWKSKLVLRMILPKTRAAVGQRESSKSLIIKAVDGWRKGYRKLAKLMVSEGRIPDENLLYFMSLEELKELLETRSPKIISKANHRRRRYNILDKYIFPEISKGFPRPINIEKPELISQDSDLVMKGVPVSQGVIKGFVRVALNLEEASHLQPGEILVTYSTDIGWSPYFPILGGVVTELGGLISHGAVVSREYGIPCIAGLHGATRQFTTGDYALLDGNKGILQRLSKPEEQE